MRETTGGLQNDAGKRHEMSPLRLITATSIFDGHDAAINIICRILQDQGAEEAHLGHNRSVAEIVSAAEYRMRVSIMNSASRMAVCLSWGLIPLWAVRIRRLAVPRH